MNVWPALFCASCVITCAEATEVISNSMVSRKDLIAEVLQCQFQVVCSFLWLDFSTDSYLARVSFFR